MCCYTQIPLFPSSANWFTFDISSVSYSWILKERLGLSNIYIPEISKLTLEPSNLYVLDVQEEPGTFTCSCPPVFESRLAILDLTCSHPLSRHEIFEIPLFNIQSTEQGF
jgi:hypothetical protein